MGWSKNDTMHLNALFPKALRAVSGGRRLVGGLRWEKASLRWKLRQTLFLNAIYNSFGSDHRQGRFNK
eukprot:985789-Amphidinium_carterae.1